MTLMVDNVRIDFCRGAKHAKLGGVSNLDLQQVIAHDVVQFPRVLGRTAYVKIRYGNLPVLYCYHTLNEQHITIGSYTFENA